ncbi:rap guanine nucleotide exchange factor 1-like, partial [Plectropomus leopardus]|uniref:rap guanine nucleotide exchange factor 1-like n=1 Tax=Plectropomus leopardus TaxID=160734 RepID=UPI001C4C56D8
MSSSRTDSKTASQFVSLTMRLKDKLHPPRIKRSERIKNTPQRVKPPDLNLQHTQHQSGGVLAEQHRAVHSSLQYFKALVDRLGVDKPEVDRLVLDRGVAGALLGGASGGVLEAVQTLVQLEPHLHESQSVSSCLNRLYKSLAELIHWADQVMLQGSAHGNRESVTMVIRAVLDAVKDLVRLAAERQDGSTPLTPVQSQTVEGQIGGSEDQQTKVTTSTVPCPGFPSEEEDEIDSAPPKPPMPFTETVPQLSVPQLSPPPQGLSPPALPPKKRHSSSGPAPCRVAIVAPMRREPEVDTQEDECLKCFSPSSADSAAEITHSGNTHT